LPELDDVQEKKTAVAARATAVFDRETKAERIIL
jgi:hypothetical protein